MVGIHEALIQRLKPADREVVGDDVTVDDVELEPAEIRSRERKVSNWLAEMGW